MNSEEFKSINKRFFANIAKHYDAPCGGGFYFRFLYKRAEALLFPFLQKSKTMLDVACGTGEVIYHLARKFPRASFVGADLTPAMIEIAKHKNAHHPNTIFVEASAQSLPFADASFENVLCSEAFHHFSEPEQVLSEIFRVTAPGGHFVLVDPVRNSRFGFFLLRWYSRRIEHAYKYYTSNDLVQELKKAGFTVHSVEIRWFNAYIVCTR